MDCEVTQKVLYTLTLTESEAIWLFEAMQNPINQTAVEESVYASKMRRDLRDLVKPPTKSMFIKEGTQVCGTNGTLL